VLIYCTTIADCAEIYKYCAERLLSDDLRVDVSATLEMYHSAVVESKKHAFVADLCSADGQLTVVVATNALGMGIDTKRVTRVVIFGIPTISRTSSKWPVVVDAEQTNAANASYTIPIASGPGNRRSISFEIGYKPRHLVAAYD
jgi:ATP-dependent helicase YprA (DUF1998 family)